jgi:hypothetical protein
MPVFPFSGINIKKEMTKFWFFTNLLSLICLLCFPLNAQIIEDFETGDLTRWKQFPSGHWKIDVEQAISGTKSLRQWSDSTTPTEDRISISLAGLAVDLDTIIYRFRLRHASNPSLSNRWTIYLAYDEDATEMHPGGKGNGYILGVNMNSSDDLIRLFKVSEGSFHEILNTKFNWEALVGILHPAAIEIRRYPSGEWNIFIYKTGSFDSLQFYGSVSNNEISQFLYFGIYYDYTSTRNGMFWFDDLSISGRFIADSIAPSVKSLNAINDSSLSISFSENMDFHEPGLITKFTLREGQVSPDSIIIISKDSLILKFRFRFPDQNWLHLAVRDLEDLSSNKLIAVTDSCFYSPVKLNDICFNEIMPDPSPVVHLPEYEFIELFNCRDYPVNLTGWTISTGEEIKILPPLVLGGKEFLILCSSSAVNSFKSFGKVAGIFGAGSFLSNSGSCLELKSSDGTIISQQCYSPDWFDDVNKKEGGWSLEKADPDIPCSGIENWTVSKDRNGGTPGKQNSNFRSTGDYISPAITSVFPDSDSSLIVSFDEIIGLNFPTNPQSFKTNHEIGSPLKCKSVLPDYTKLCLIFKNHFVNDIIYSIILDGAITDCAGNHAEIQEWKFQLPSIPDSQDVVFNEIMYHPISGCPEFIELYNRSKKAFNLGDFRIGLKDLYSGELKSLSSPIQKNTLFLAEEYIVLASKPGLLYACYPHTKPKSAIRFDGMPVLTDEGQKLQLISPDLSVIDEMIYKDALQFALLTNSIGVSLERIDFNRPSSDPTNWHSASSTSGFCTPGSENSQYIQAEQSNSVLKVDPEIFSPDNDGIKDILTISCCFNQSGFVGNLIIYDSKGRQVRRLANNELLACKGQFSWDGSMNGGAAAQIGIYIIWFEVFNLAGKTEVYKKICVVSRTR